MSSGLRDWINSTWVYHSSPLFTIISMDLSLLFEEESCSGLNPLVGVRSTGKRDVCDHFHPLWARVQGQPDTLYRCSGVSCRVLGFQNRYTNKQTHRCPDSSQNFSPVPVVWVSPCMCMRPSLEDCFHINCWVEYVFFLSSWVKLRNVKYTWRVHLQKQINGSFLFAKKNLKIELKKNCHFYFIKSTLHQQFIE